ncbi:MULTISPECIES: NfeD family protein [Bacillaceae]|uniref:Nodulation protein NfeD n=1 Tax=Evansella alkalicola TaxID=745819 RepID=A0ABS6JZI3_9BACI|nr:MULTISPECIES: nodulation protein NfeD [Bacillaceae]MBU9722505.1 nodulation protein NfeD [Bacillus alkalicola]
MKKFRILCFTSMILFSFLLSLLPSSVEGQGEGKLVFYIPVEQEVERGLQAFLERSIDTAIEEGADHIVFEVDTPGGFVDAAGNIATLIRNTPIPTTAYVIDQALSAGAYISLNADKIVMKPGSTMGSASVIDGSGNAAEDKAQSAWLAEMRQAAELNGRNPIYALAMADPTIDIPESPEGEILTLTPREAMEVGYAEAIANDRTELLDFLELQNAREQEMEITFAEQIARFVTNPIIIPILLSIGSMGLVLELYSPGFGVPGIMGLSALFLFFFGHMVAGFAGMETFILFGVGIVLLLIEIFVPGFGIFGALGIGAIIGSMVLASYSTTNIILSILIAIVLTVAMSIIFFKYVGYRGPLKRIILKDATKSEEGYVSNVTREEIIGKTGETLTVLRPAGTAVFNEERLDVVSEGGYIGQGRKVKIVSTAGSRIVVRELMESKEE